MTLSTDYYEVEIVSCGANIGATEFSMFGNETKVFKTIDEVRHWMKETYPDDIKRSITYVGNNVPCGYVYEYINGDWSHSPVEHWLQQDWVSVDKVHAENVFEDVKYEVPVC